MLMDEKMDHGPIVAQKKIEIPHWPVWNSELERILMTEGGKLLAQILPHYLDGEIVQREQNHDLATYCSKLFKDDGRLNLQDEPAHNLRKIRGYEGWPGTFDIFWDSEGDPIRVKILDAHIEGGKLVIDRVVPAGKKEMSYRDFIQSGAKPMEQ
jgi:methionyl-tRNA formyltransferase